MNPESCKIITTQGTTKIKDYKVLVMGLETITTQHLKTTTSRFLMTNKRIGVKPMVRMRKRPC